MALHQVARIRERIEELLNHSNYDPAQDLEKGIEYANPIQRKVCDVLGKEFPNEDFIELVNLCSKVMREMRTDYEIKNR